MANEPAIVAVVAIGLVAGEAVGDAGDHRSDAAASPAQTLRRQATPNAYAAKLIQGHTAKHTRSTSLMSAGVASALSSDAAVASDIPPERGAVVDLSSAVNESPDDRIDTSGHRRLAPSK